MVSAAQSRHGGDTCNSRKEADGHMPAGGLANTRATEQWLHTRTCAAQLTALQLRVALCGASAIVVIAVCVCSARVSSAFAVAAEGVATV